MGPSQTPSGRRLIATCSYCGSKQRYVSGTMKCNRCGHTDNNPVTTTTANSGRRPLGAILASEPLNEAERQHVRIYSEKIESFYDRLVTPGVSRTRTISLVLRAVRDTGLTEGEFHDAIFRLGQLDAERLLKRVESSWRNLSLKPKKLAASMKKAVAKKKPKRKRKVWLRAVGQTRKPGSHRDNG